MSQLPDENILQVRQNHGTQSKIIINTKHIHYPDSDKMKVTIPIDPDNYSGFGKYIDMIKQYMRVTLEDGLNSTNPAEINEMVYLISLAGMRITRLLNFQHRFTSRDITK